MLTQSVGDVDVARIRLLRLLHLHVRERLTGADHIIPASSLAVLLSEQNDA